MSRLPVVLLPPSEGKAPGGTGAPWRPGAMSFPELDEQRRAVAAAVAEVVSGPGAAGLLGVKGAALDAAVRADLEVMTSPTRPAIRRYTGVLYDALDAASLRGRDRDRLRRSVVILSGLWGAVRPGDPVPDYKLKMGASLPGIGRLSTAWRPLVTASLAPVVAGRTVWDLLPNEHRAAWAPLEPGERGAPRGILSVRFLDETTDRRGERRFTTVSHWNKLLKGALVRHVLATGADEPDALVRFEHPEGYVYDPSLTTEAGGVVSVCLVRPAR